MGFDWSKVGNISFETAAKVGKAGLELGKDALKATGKSALSYGASLLTPKTLMAAGGAGIAAYGLADADKRNDAEKIGVTAGVTAGALSGVAGIGTAATAVGIAGLNMAATVGGAAMSLGRASLKMPKEAVSFENMKDIEFNALGKGLVMGNGLLEGGKKAIRKYEQIKMGTNDGMLRTSTPIIPQRATPAYANNGGATGDLVFSMYNNR